MVFPSSGQTRSGPTDILMRQKSLGFDITQTAVQDKEIAHLPGVWVDSVLGQMFLDAVAEDGELVTELTFLFATQLAGYIPPFGLKLRVATVIAGKGEATRLKGFLPGRGAINRKKS